jgi:putative thioredoxin
MHENRKPGNAGLSVLLPNGGRWRSCVQRRGCGAVLLSAYYGAERSAEGLRDRTDFRSVRGRRETRPEPDIMSVDVKDFETEVVQLSGTVPVLVDFWAEWCAPCRVLGPVLERLAEKNGGKWELKKVDTEALPDVAARYGVRSIPNVKLFVDGKPVDEFVGALPQPAVEAWLAKAVPDPSQKEIERAEVLARAGRGDEAVVILDPIVAASPENERARSLFAILIVFSDHRRALAMVEDVHEASPSGRHAEAVRAFGRLFRYHDDHSLLPASPVKTLFLSATGHLLRKEFDAALDEFIGVIRQDRTYDDDGARKACLAIFAYLGEDHDVTRRHRREFGSALNV